MSLFLENVKHERVELPEEVAKQLFHTVAEVEAIATLAAGGEDDADVEDVEDVEAPSTAAAAEEPEPLKLTDLECDLVTLQATVDYAMLPESARTANIPKPLSRPLAEIVTEGEMALMRRAEREDFLVQLLDIASQLKFEQLLNLCSAYMAVRIDEISKRAPTIMEGAAQLREFLHMENAWTEEEMENLTKEMEYAKQVDPRVY